MLVTGKNDAWSVIRIENSGTAIGFANGACTICHGKHLGKPFILREDAEHRILLDFRFFMAYAKLNSNRTQFEFGSIPESFPR